MIAPDAGTRRRFGEVVMKVHVELTIDRPRWMRRPSRRRGILAGVVGLTLLVPGLALASHSFVDVPDSNTFHTNIGRVYGARITAGCDATHYCPGDNVTRAQMAAFLNRTGTRGDSDSSVGTALSGSLSTLGTVAIKAGDVTGGTAYVKIDAAVQSFTLSTAGCACTAFFYIYDSEGEIAGPGYLQVQNAPVSGYSLDGSALTTLVAVPTGVTQTFTVKAYVDTTTATVNAFADVTATYVPFASTGGNAPAGVSNFQPRANVPGTK
jgi:hypothetical protein